MEIPRRCINLKHESVKSTRDFAHHLYAQGGTASIRSTNSLDPALTVPPQEFFANLQRARNVVLDFGVAAHHEIQLSIDHATMDPDHIHTFDATLKFEFTPDTYGSINTQCEQHYGIDVPDQVLVNKLSQARVIVEKIRTPSNTGLSFLPYDFHPTRQVAHMISTYVSEKLDKKVYLSLTRNNDIALTLDAPVVYSLPGWEAAHAQRFLLEMHRVPYFIKEPSTPKQEYLAKLTATHITPSLSPTALLPVYEQIAQHIDQNIRDRVNRATQQQLEAFVNSLSICDDVQP